MWRLYAQWKKPCLKGNFGQKKKKKKKKKKEKNTAF